MDVTGHTTTLRDRTRITSHSETTDNRGGDGGTHTGYLSIPGVGLVSNKTLMYGGGALAVVLLLVGGGGGSRPEFNFDSGVL